MLIADLLLCVGGGVQGTLALTGGACEARFGSFEYACEALPKGKAMQVGCMCLFPRSCLNVSKAP